LVSQRPGKLEASRRQTVVQQVFFTTVEPQPFDQLGAHSIVVEIVEQGLLVGLDNPSDRPGVGAGLIRGCTCEPRP
jgi:hypothetical protein